MTLRPPTTSVSPVLEPGIVTGESASIGAVKAFGAEVVLNGRVSGHETHPSKLKVMLPVNEYVTVDPPGVGV